jgi:hypothetical protein
VMLLDEHGAEAAQKSFVLGPRGPNRHIGAHRRICRSSGAQGQCAPSL